MGFQSKSASGRGRGGERLFAAIESPGVGVTPESYLSQDSRTISIVSWEGNDGGEVGCIARGYIYTYKFYYLGQLGEMQWICLVGIIAVVMTVIVGRA